MTSLECKMQGARSKFLLLTGCIAAFVGGAATEARSEADLRGGWIPEAYVASLQTVDGKPPPLRPQAKVLLEQRIATRKAAKSDDPALLCQPAGIPRLMYQSRPFLVVQTPLKVTFAHEYQHSLRHIYLEDNPKAGDEPTWQGRSTGRWEGEELVVNTTGFNDRTWLDEAGLPHGAQLKVQERFRRIDASRMEARIVIDDPENYTAPWSTKLVFKAAPTERLNAHICTESLFPEPPNARPRPGR
jgi:hypothetical protein